jgi:hypothetical protein
MGDRLGGGFDREWARILEAGKRGDDGMKSFQPQMNTMDADAQPGVGD